MMQVVPVYTLPPDQVQAYWQTLYMHDLLKYRLGDSVDPTWTEVVEMFLRQSNKMYHAVEDGVIVADVAVGEFIQGAVQVHFSMAPNLGPRASTRIAKGMTEAILSWPEVKEVFGITSIFNRATILLALRAGYRKVGIVEDGSYYLGHKTAGVMLTYG